MDKYLHHVSGFFVHREEAESTYSKLVERGLPRERLRIFAADSVAPAAAAKAGSDKVLKDVLILTARSEPRLALALARLLSWRWSPRT